MAIEGPRWHDAVQVTLRTAADWADRVDAEASFPAATLDQMKRNGMLTAAFPPETGGFGCDLPVLVSVARAMGAVCPSTALVWLMHTQQALTILRFASVTATADFLDRNRASALYIASVTTEKRTGGSLAEAEGSLVPDDAGLTLNRHAPLVTGGEVADAFLVKSGLDHANGNVHPLFVLVYRDELTISVRRRLSMLGMRGLGNTELDLRGHVPSDRILEVDGQGYPAVMTTFAAIAHLGWSAIWIGCAEAAWQRTLRHLRRRSAQQLTSEALRVSMSEIRLRLEAASAMLSMCTEEVASTGLFATTLADPDVQIHLNALKIMAARGCAEAVDQMINLVGVESYIKDSPLRLDRSARDIRAASLIYNDRRLHLATGTLSVLDPAVKTLGRDTSINVPEPDYE